MLLCMVLWYSILLYYDALFNIIMYYCMLFYMTVILLYLIMIMLSCIIPYHVFDIIYICVCVCDCYRLSYRFYAYRLCIIENQTP